MFSSSVRFTFICLLVSLNTKYIRNIEVIIMREIYLQWKKDEEAPFAGWDFSYLENRCSQDQPPWDYKALASQYLQRSEATLDIGTGGGEFLASLVPLYGRVVAVEGWQPNVIVARRRLEPLGVEVLETNICTKLPFTDGEFDLVLNHHSAFNVEEIFRILRKGGTFLTQQVRGDNLHDLINEFNAVLQYKDWTLGKLIKQVKDTGFHMKEAQEWSGTVEFKDVGAIVYLLKNIPWIIQDFNVDDYLSYL